jgi:NAD(P)-dependent dehydrogenase (short-subunit alcohol dehydrogenase family)
MKAQGAGAIVNISSTAAISTNANVAYKATKAGVVAFTQQLCNEGAPERWRTQ